MVTIAALALLGAGCNDGSSPASPGSRTDNTPTTGSSQPLNAEWLLKSSSSGQSLAGTTWK